MAVANHDQKAMSEVKANWSFCRLPFWQSSNGDDNNNNSSVADHSSIKVASVAKSFLPTRRRLGLDPPNKLYFPCMYAWVVVHTSYTLCSLQSAFCFL